jgi:hypothetical protein
MGNYTVAVVQSFSLNFTKNNPFITFNLSVSYESFTVDLTPTKPSDYFMYWIGQRNPSVDILKYFNITLSANFILTIIAK